MKKHILIAAFIGTAFMACHKPEHPGFEKSASGIFYKELVKSKDTTHVHLGDLLTLQVVCKTEKDCVLTDTRKTDHPLRMLLPKSRYPGDVFQAIATMKLGDSTQFLFGAKDYFEKLEGMKVPPYIDTTSMLTFTVKIDKVEPKAIVEAEQKKRTEERQKAAEIAKVEEPKALDKYLADNKIKTKPTTSGFYYIETVKGKGDAIKAGQIVSVLYTGKLLNGQVFDASSMHDNQPIDLPVGQHQVIQGWDEALMMMKKGGKASVIIPSALAYGEQGKGPIPPFTTLLFDMEIVGVKDAPQQPMGPQGMPQGRPQGPPQGQPRH
jgi:FKBP-type peptidyl-prolyl cis-trans isomerase FkpA